MLDTDWNLLSTYIGIVYRQGEGLFYFTLERSYSFTGGDDIHHLLCLIGEYSRQSFFLVENNMNAFTEGILDVLTNWLQ
jgi:hypothetical protein